MTIKTSPEAEQRVRELRAEGKSYAQIEKEVRVSAATIHRIVGKKSRGASTLDKLVAMRSPRAKAAERTETKQTELERLRQIVERLAARYPSILVKVL